MDAGRVTGGHGMRSDRRFPLELWNVPFVFRIYLCHELRLRHIHVKCNLSDEKIKEKERNNEDVYYIFLRVSLQSVYSIL